MTASIIFLSLRICRQFFSCVSESLKEGGIFIFDINTPYKYEVLMADNTIAENRDEGSFIWDNYYDADEK